MNTILSTLALVGAVSAQTPLVCADFPRQQNVDSTRYVGEWYEISRTAERRYGQSNGECVTAHYTTKENGEIIVDNRARQPDGSYTIGLANARPSLETGTMTVSFNNMGYPETPNYNIIFTDYDYSIVYGCDLRLNREDMYIIARTSSITDAKLAELKTIANDAVPSYDFAVKSEDSVQDATCEYDFTATQAVALGSIKT